MPGATLTALGTAAALTLGVLAGAAHAQERAVEGFAPEPICESVAQTGVRRCWTSTKGYGETAPNAHIADLGFACSSTGRELLGVSFHAGDGAAFTSGTVTLAVRWDEGPLRSIPSAASATRSEDDDETLAYLYAVEQWHLKGMLSAMRRHRLLAVALPYASGRARWARFALEGAEAAVAATRLACARDQRFET